MVQRRGTEKYDLFSDATDVAHEVGVYGEAYPRYQVLANGTVKYGDGTAAPAALFPAGMVVRTRLGASYTLALADASGALTLLSHGSAGTVTVPLNATVAFPVGSVVRVAQAGAGQFTVTAADGVTITTAKAGLVTAAAGAMVMLVKVATDTWYATGDLVAAS